jgi:cystathionine beta-synthase
MKSLVHADITGTIGNTPLVRLNRVTKELSCEVFAKLEFFNPGGSVKDRIGDWMIEDFERSGKLFPGGTVVEATSGNTGVGLAIACALKGYKAVFVMPDKMSQEKVQLLRAFGAKVVITPTAVAPEDPRSYYSVANRIVDETPGAILANQYHNPANPQAHYLTTGPEIWEQTGGRVTDIVMGMGTGGTITGVARYMKDKGYPVKIVGVDPLGSILYEAWRQGGSLENVKAETYKVEGIGEDFIPTTLELDLIDDMIQVTDAESFQWARRLVREEGIFCGGSSGSAMAGVMHYAADLGSERTVVVIFPDSGSRYLSKIFNDDWMREHGFFESVRESVTVGSIVEKRGPRKLITASEEDTITEVVARMREHGISQLPVKGGGGELVGLVTEGDLFEHLVTSEGAQDPDEPIREWVDRDVAFAQETQPLSQLLPALIRNKVVVIVDEQSRPVNILTTIDILDYLTVIE